MKVWVFHLTENIEKDKHESYAKASAGCGCTVFLHYNDMYLYLLKDGRRWSVAQIECASYHVEWEVGKGGFLLPVSVGKVIVPGGIQGDKPFTPLIFNEDEEGDNYWGLLKGMFLIAFIAVVWYAVCLYLKYKVI